MTTHTITHTHSRPPAPQAQPEELSSSAKARNRRIGEANLNYRQVQLALNSQEYTSVTLHLAHQALEAGMKALLSHCHRTYNSEVEDLKRLLSAIRTADPHWHWEPKSKLELLQRHDKAHLVHQRLKPQGIDWDLLSDRLSQDLSMLYHRIRALSPGKGDDRPGFDPFTHREEGTQPLMLRYRNSDGKDNGKDGVMGQDLKLTAERLTFQEALAYLQKGIPVARACWRPEKRGRYRWLEMPENHYYPPDSPMQQILLRTAPDQVTPWPATQEDILARDWLNLEPEYDEEDDGPEKNPENDPEAGESEYDRQLHAKQQATAKLDARLAQLPNPLAYNRGRHRRNS